MKILERILLIWVALGLYLKLSGYDGAAVFLLIGFMLLLNLPYIFGFALYNGISFRNIPKSESYKTIGKSRLITGVLLGFAAAIAGTGVLFKILLLTGANQMLLVGAAVTALIALAATFRWIIKKRPLDTFYKNVFIRSAVIVLISVPLLFVTNHAVVKVYYRNQPDILEKYLRVLDNPMDDQAQEELNKALEKH